MKNININQISDTLFEVNSYSVKIQTKKGRRILLCSCQNHARYPVENAFCSHKEKVLKYIFTKDIKEKLDKLISEYQFCLDSKLSIKAEVILEDLNNLRDIINGRNI